MFILEDTIDNLFQAHLLNRDDSQSLQAILYAIFTKSRSEVLLHIFINLLIEYARPEKNPAGRRTVQGWILKCAVNLLQKIASEKAYWQKLFREDLKAVKRIFGQINLLLK